MKAKFFIGSNPIPRIKKAKAVPILYNLGFCFIQLAFLHRWLALMVEHWSPKPSVTCSSRVPPEYKNA